MSTTQTTLWLEANREMFEGALEEGNYALARDVIEDCRDYGFDSEAKQMEKELLNIPVSQFAYSMPTLQSKWDQLFEQMDCVIADLAEIRSMNAQILKMFKGLIN